MPKRIKLSRARGWRMPEGAVKVDRSTRWGNPFTIKSCIDAGYKGSHAELTEMSVVTFRGWLAGAGIVHSDERRHILDNIGKLRGKDLACWCSQDGPCHADVLLEIANAEPRG